MHSRLTPIDAPVTKKRPLDTQTESITVKEDGSFKRAFEPAKIAAGSISSVTSKYMDSHQNDALESRMVFGMRSTGFVGSSQQQQTPRVIRFDKNKSQPRSAAANTPKFSSEERQRRLQQQARAKRRSSGQPMPSSVNRRLSVGRSAKKSKWQKTMAYGKAALMKSLTSAGPSSRFSVLALIKPSSF